MKVLRATLIAFSLFCCVNTFGQVKDIDNELVDFSEKIAASVKDHDKKKIAVIDFTDLQGTTSGELGKYIAEQLSVNLVMGKREFSVLDRANLKSILKEHKLTATGLIDPENAKKLGMFAGVDALILGSILPKGTKISLTAKIITTDTAEIIGAVRAEFKADEAVQQLMAHPSPTNSSASSGAIADPESTIKTFGDLQVEIEPIKIIAQQKVRLSLTLSNKNPKRSIWVALKDEGKTVVNGTITDSAGTEFQTSTVNVSGLRVAFLSAYNNNRMIQATQIPPGESMSAAINFVSAGNRAAPGTARVQLEILVATSWNGSGFPSAHNLIAKVEVN